MKNVVLLSLACLLLLNACDKAENQTTSSEPATAPLQNQQVSSSTIQTNEQKNTESVQATQSTDNSESLINESESNEKSSITFPADTLAEYQKLVEWENLQKQKIQALAKQVHMERQATAQKKTTEDLEKSIIEYTQQLDLSIQDFNQFSFNSDIVAILAVKKKSYYQLYSESLLLAVKEFTTPSPDLKAEIHQKVIQIQGIDMEIKEIEAQLKENK